MPNMVIFFILIFDFYLILLLYSLNVYNLICSKSGICRVDGIHLLTKAPELSAVSPVNFDQ